MSENTQTSIEGFFPILVQFSHNPGAKSQHPKMRAAIEQIRKDVPNSLPEGHSAGHFSTLWSGFSLLDREAFHPLRAFIVGEATKFANFNCFNITRHPLKLNESWVNIHGHGNYQEAHVHQNSVLSGVYYVNAPEKGGTFNLHSPYKYQMLQPPMTQVPSFAARVVPIEAQEGMLVMFRSFVEHGVNPNDSNQERISISFNFTM